MNTIEITLVLLFFLSSPVTVDMPSELELLDKYAANQNKVTSFIVKTETTAIVARAANEYKPDILRRDIEARVDGKKSRILDKRWFQLPSRNAPVNIEDADIYDWLWDGNCHMMYRVGLRVDMDRNEQAAKRSLNTLFSGVALFGIWFDYDERLDVVLRKAKTISVRDKIDRIGSEDCYVIDAKTDSGKYTVWIDPNHGYQIAQAELRVVTGEHFGDITLDDKESRFFSIRNIRYDNIDGIWIPMEIDIEEKIVGPEPDQSWIVDTHHNVTQITLNPDHEALGSFEPVIANGTTVIDRDLGIKYTWQDGELIPDVDEYAVDQIREMAQELKNQNKVPPGLITTEKTETATDDRITDTNGSTETQTNANEGIREIQAQSRTIPFIVLTLISLSIIAIIGWKIFIRSKT